MIDTASLAQVEGPNLVLRLIRPEDADYVLSLRKNPAYNRYLSEVRGTVEDQRRWIETYKTRESEGRELYYMIERKDRQPCGLVRLYEIGAESFAWGSWILDSSKPRKAALESAVLSFGIGFRALDLERALVEVRVQNEHALGFYLRLGMIESHRTERDVHLVYPRKRYESGRECFLNVTQQEART